MARVRMAVIGVGHLGKEHARILAGLPEVELVGVVDVHAEQAQAVARRHGTNGFTDYRPLLNAVDAACIVVPTVHHHAVAGEFLRRGIPLLIEKPIASTLEEGQELVTLAERHGIILQVGHIERFNPAFEELQRRPIQPKFVECERLGPFSGRSTDIGVVLDLMIHDLDALLALVKAPVVSVEALGVTVFGGHEDLANARLTFTNGCTANLSASRINFQASRKMRVWAAEGFATVDFAKRSLTMIQPSENLCKNGLDTRGLSAGQLTMLKNDIFDRHLQNLHLDCNHGDQLTKELQHFVHCVRTGETPRVTGAAGRDALGLAGRILESIRTHAWNGAADGCVGPSLLPQPLGQLFQARPNVAAA